MPQNLNLSRTSENDPLYEETVSASDYESGSARLIKIKIEEGRLGQTEQVMLRQRYQHQRSSNETMSVALQVEASTPKVAYPSQLGPKSPQDYAVGCAKRPREVDILQESKKNVLGRKIWHSADDRDNVRMADLSSTSSGLPSDSNLNTSGLREDDRGRRSASTQRTSVSLIGTGFVAPQHGLGREKATVVQSPQDSDSSGCSRLSSESRRKILLPKLSAKQVSSYSPLMGVAAPLPVEAQTLNSQIRHASPPGRFSVQVDKLSSTAYAQRLKCSPQPAQQDYRTGLSTQPPGLPDVLSTSAVPQNIAPLEPTNPVAERDVQASLSSLRAHTPHPHFNFGRNDPQRQESLFEPLAPHNGQSFSDPSRRGPETKFFVSSGSTGPRATAKVLSTDKAPSTLFVPSFKLTASGATVDETTSLIFRTATGPSAETNDVATARHLHLASGMSEKARGKQPAVPRAVLNDKCVEDTSRVKEVTAAVKKEMDKVRAAGISGLSVERSFEAALLLLRTREELLQNAVRRLDAIIPIDKHLRELYSDIERLRRQERGLSLALGKDA